MGEVFSELLSPDGMTLVRAALVDNYEWFTHAARTRDFKDIQKGSLRPRIPGCAVPSELTRVIGASSENILCLQPYPKLRPMHLGKLEPMFKMAISRDLLPERNGVDWSFGGYLQDLCARRRAHPDWPPERVFLEHVRCNESLVSYDEIPASALRVCPMSAPNSPPSDWPELMRTKREDIHELYPDALGNVRV